MLHISTLKKKKIKCELTISMSNLKNVLKAQKKHPENSTKRRPWNRDWIVRAKIVRRENRFKTHHHLLVSLCYIIFGRTFEGR